MKKVEVVLIEREASICSSMTLDGISSGGGGVQVMMENEGEHDEAKSETSGSTYFRDWFGNSNFNFTIPKVTPTLPNLAPTSLVCNGKLSSIYSFGTVLYQSEADNIQILRTRIRQERRRPGPLRLSDSDKWWRGRS